LWPKIRFKSTAYVNFDRPAQMKTHINADIKDLLNELKLKFLSAKEMKESKEETKKNFSNFLSTRTYV
jgi:hypothetical protein